MADKRISKRKIKRLPVTFLCGLEEHKGISSNVSLTGIFITVRSAFKPCSNTMAMILELEEERRIALRGEIARIAKKSKFDRGNLGIGVQLTNISQMYQDYVQALP